MYCKHDRKVLTIVISLASNHIIVTRTHLCFLDAWMFLDASPCQSLLLLSITSLTLCTMKKQMHNQYQLNFVDMFSICLYNCHVPMCFTIEFLGNSHKPTKTKVHQTALFGHCTYCFKLLFCSSNCTLWIQQSK